VKNNRADIYIYARIMSAQVVVVVVLGLLCFTQTLGDLFRRRR
jgi:hypothetical protein